MDLSAADVKLLGQASLRQRFGERIMALFVVLMVVFLGAGVWCWAKLDSSPFDGTTVDTPFQAFRIHGYYGAVTALILCAWNASVYGLLAFMTWDQRRNDRLLLKLMDRVSGYPDFS